MIFGIGVDIVSTIRIRNLYQRYGTKFLTKILTSQEQEIFHRLTDNQVNFLSKRFAAKEAFVKALGTGFKNQLYPKDIGTHSDQYNNPTMHYTKEVEALLNSSKITTVHLSLADEKSYAIAFVTMES